MKFLKCLTAVALVLLLSTCSGEHPRSSIDPRTDFAESIHSLYVMIFWITLAILMLVWAVMAYVLVRFRARPDTPLPRQIRGHMGMEIAWTILPTFLTMSDQLIYPYYAGSAGDIAEAARGPTAWWSPDVDTQDADLLGGDHRDLVPVDPGGVRGMAAGGPGVRPPVTGAIGPTILAIGWLPSWTFI